MEKGQGNIVDVNKPNRKLNLIEDGLGENGYE